MKRLIAPLWSALWFAACAPLPTRPVETPRTVASPEVSRTRGSPQGVVLLWPRIVPRDASSKLDGVASALQKRLLEMLMRHFPRRAIDVRPSPERVCPRPGCLSPAVGLVLAARDEGCVAVVTVSSPGESPQRLVPWLGEVRMPEHVPFREPPESTLAIIDFAPCEALGSIGKRDDEIEAVLKGLSREGGLTARP